MGKKRDGTHIFIDADVINRFRNWMLGGCISIIVGGAGLLAERYFNTVTRAEYDLVIQGQKDLRQSIRAMSSRYIECENRCRVHKADFDAHLRNGEHEKKHRPTHWGEE